ncbi:hypothetical protein SKP52_02625 [Sphingopyxis fribergensis]|uniref:Uncharacterized protein n=1 Tax=Sphingopyxis fribergensis TaxID=1515612 RepID=A0A0A7PBT4_9SPHN|nr:hypothetical protein [Sphingopyxis fribergensis]AJA07460.1 hypothetical protein SKP52_02625 [Sphingopyxis fribergensis]
MLKQDSSREDAGATLKATASSPPPRQDIPQANLYATASLIAPAEPHSVGHLGDEAQIKFADRTPSDCGHFVNASHDRGAAVGSELTDQGQPCFGTPAPDSLIGEIVSIYRRYEDLRRARQRIELQAIATCRTVCGGDKTEGMKLYKAPTEQVALWLMPYGAAMAPLTVAIKEHEKLLTKLGKKLPVAAWADTVPGLSPRFLAAIVGECGTGPGEFKSVSALWKRMGMAVINGGRQRRVTGDAAIEHGYVARRRALMWNIGDQVAVRQGVRNPKDDDGKPTGANAINDWGALYLERKAYEIAREVEPGKPVTPMHAHNRAKRYVEKRLLRELWKAWRRALARPEPSGIAPAS